MSPQLRESARLGRVRRGVIPAVDQVLRDYGMRPAHRVDIEELPGQVRVRIACTDRVPQYVADRLRFAVAHELARLPAPPASTVAVVAARGARHPGRRR